MTWLTLGSFVDMIRKVRKATGAKQKKLPCKMAPVTPEIHLWMPLLLTGVVTAK